MFVQTMKKAFPAIRCTHPYCSPVPCMCARTHVGIRGLHHQIDLMPTREQLKAEEDVDSHSIRGELFPGNEQGTYDLFFLNQAARHSG